MAKDAKCYKVMIGDVIDKKDYPNSTSYNVIAKDALEASRKVKLERGQYIAEVSIIASVDLL